MKDSNFSTTGFKYPDGVFGRHTQDLNFKFCSQPKKLELKQKTPEPSRSTKYINFGVNLGPKRPTMPVGKYLGSLLSRDRIQMKVQKDFANMTQARMHHAQSLDPIVDASDVYQKSATVQNSLPMRIDLSRTKSIDPGLNKKTIIVTTQSKDYNSATLQVAKDITAVRRTENGHSALIKRDRTIYRYANQPYRQASSYYVLPKRRSSPFDQSPVQSQYGRLNYN